MCFFISPCTWAEFKIAAINDSDGYTNVRKAPDPHSKVVLKIEEDELFLCETGKYAWWKAKDFFGNQGFIHRSRVRFYRDLADKEKEGGGFAWAYSVTDSFQDIDSHPIEKPDFPSYGTWAVGREHGQIYRHSSECDGRHHQETLFYHKETPKALLSQISEDVEGMQKFLQKLPA